MWYSGCGLRWYIVGVAWGGIVGGAWGGIVGGAWGGIVGGGQLVAPLVGLGLNGGQWC